MQSGCFSLLVTVNSGSLMETEPLETTAINQVIGSNVVIQGFKEMTKSPLDAGKQSLLDKEEDGGAAPCLPHVFNI